MLSLIAFFCIAFFVEAETNPGCLQGWSFFTKSSKCFKVFGGLNDPIRPTTWDNAEDYCNTFNGGHLASFHSEDEILFVVELSQQAAWDNGGAAELHVGHTNTGNWKWQWTDGSRWTYTKWWSGYEIEANPNIQSQAPRGKLHTRQAPASTMWLQSGANLWAFACQMPPSSEG